MIWVDNFLKIAYHSFCVKELHFAFFHSEGNVPLSRQDLKISFMGGKAESPHNFSIHILIMSCPWALFGSSLFIILAISALVTGIDESVLVVFMLSLA